MKRTVHGKRGFTLIELMIVVAILSILTTLAMPSFQDRVIRAQVSEGIVLADFVKRAVEEHRARHKRLPQDNAAAGLPRSSLIVGNHVEDVAVKDGVITITYGNRSNRHLRGLKLALRPAVVDGQSVVPIAWVCGLASVPQGMVVAGADTTTLQPPQLPVDCR
jgi:type IV pilus assembly protein PilA